jgi:EAL domain-containing protein (putative c-di-GMP-specific phosphodiesterase class I)/FixJ family two-component response regulator
MSSDRLVALIVDDQLAVRKQIGAALRQCGASEVLEAGNAKQAIDLVREHDELRLIVCDLMMPDKDGVELLRDIALTHTRAAVVLVSSADAPVLRASAKLAVEHGLHVLGSLSKPVSAAQLSEAIALLRRNQPAQPSGRFDVTTDLAQALRSGCVLPHYQPLIDVRTGELWGVEALARWNHATRGLLAAGAFIRQAEEAGLARRVTDAVVEHAMQDLAQWRTLDLQPGLTINLAPSAIDRLDWPDMLMQRALQTGLDPARIVVEITESTIGLNPLNLLDVATRIRLKGFGLAIDDYGNGDCTLEQLKRLPLSYLKIDASLAAGALRDATVRAIFESTVDMGHRLGTKVVVEGVEDEPHWRLARESGCDYAQGYFLGRPMPAAQIPRWNQSRPQLRSDP